MGHYRQVDHLRQLLYHQRDFNRYVPHEGGAAALIVAQKMRNAMDHPIGSIAKYGPTAKNVPMFGILGWVWYSEGDLTITEDRAFTLRGRNATLISVSAIQHQFTVSANDIFDKQVYLPWGNIVLWAFGKVMRFADAFSVATTLKDHLNTVTADNAARALADAGMEPVIAPSDIAGQLREEVDGEWTGVLD